MKKSVTLVLIVATLASVADTLAISASDDIQSAVKQPLGCLIQPDRVAEVGSPVVGIVESMLVERGDMVRKGQVIAILRNSVDSASLNVAHSRAEAEAELHAANANLTFTKQSLARSQELHDKKFISTQALDQAVAENAVAKQKLAQAEEQRRIWINEASVAKARLADRIIRSPFDGVIAERYISVGERVEERPLVKVAKMDPLRIEVIMPSALFGSVATGSDARVTPSLAGSVAVNAKVTLVDRILDAASGTFRVQLKLPNPKVSIPAGLRCKVDFTAATEPAKPSPNKTGANTKLEVVSPKIAVTTEADSILPYPNQARANTNLKTVSLDTSTATRSNKQSGLYSVIRMSPFGLKLDYRLSIPRSAVASPHLEM